MYYVQDIYCVINDSNLLLDNEERSFLEKFSDEMVRFSKKTEANYSQNKALMSAFHKLIDSGLFLRYLQILLKRDSYTVDNFYDKMDNE